MNRIIRKFSWHVTDEFMEWVQSALVQPEKPTEMAQVWAYLTRPGYLVLNAVIKKVKATDMLKYPPVGDYLLSARMVYVGKRKCRDPELQKAWREKHKQGMGIRAIYDGGVNDG